MSRLRVQHAVEHSAVDVYSAADSGAYREIDHAIKTLCRTICYFAEAGTVHIRIKTDRNAEGFPERRDYVHILPRQFWRIQDLAESRRSLYHIDRPECRDTECLDVFCFEIIHHLRNCLFRCCRRNTDLFENLSCFITDRADHLCSAAFKCSKSHNSILPPYAFDPYINILVYSAAFRNHCGTTCPSLKFTIISFVRLISSKTSVISVRGTHSARSSSSSCLVMASLPSRSQ